MNRSTQCRILHKLLVAAAFLMFLSGCATDQTGNTPLILATWQGDAEKVTVLLSAGADVNTSNREGLTALMASTWGKTGRGDVTIAKALIAKGAKVNAANVYGRTALMEVAGNGNLEFVTLLLDAGADANAQTLSGGTALHEAAVNGHGEIARALLNKGARPNVSNKLGQTPLMLACTCAGPRDTCPERPEMVRLLIAAGADVNVKDARGNTAWHWVTGGTKAERDEVIRLLKAAGVTE
jgi:ankyrin repeat protein